MDDNINSVSNKENNMRYIVNSYRLLDNGFRLDKPVPCKVGNSEEVYYFGSLELAQQKADEWNLIFANHNVLYKAGEAK